MAQLQNSKFRAWDRESKRMLYPSTEDVYFQLTNHGIIVFDLSIAPYDEIYPIFESVIIMQTTKIKDYKHPERDIIQGDIVEDRAGTKYVVRYNEDFCANCLYLGEEMHMMFYPNIDLTVVGNEYENPELLEVEE